MLQRNGNANGNENHSHLDLALGTGCPRVIALWTPGWGRCEDLGVYWEL